MRTTIPHRSSAFTLVEILIAAAVGVVGMATLLSGVVSIQRCFVNTEAFGIAKMDQSRLSDYLALDLRRAKSLTAGTDGITILTVQVPDYYTNDGVPRTPTITNYVVHYGTNGSRVPVVYRKNGSTIERQVGTGIPSVIATNVSDFQLSIQDLGKVVKTQITFAPTLRGTPNEGARTATTVYNTTLLRNRIKDS